MWCIVKGVSHVNVYKIRYLIILFRNYDISIELQKLYSVDLLDKITNYSSFIR